MAGTSSDGLFKRFDPGYYKMVEVGTGGVGTRFIKTDWPHEVGLSGGFQKQEGENIRLMPEKSVVYDKEMKLLT